MVITSYFNTKNAERSSVKKVFVTGISGLLGTNLANLLLVKGFILYAMIREGSRYHGKKHKNLNLIRMDLWGDYDPYLQKSDFVVHLAADTSTNKTSPRDYEMINYKATRRLFEHAQQLGVRRFIYISTANTLGFGSRSDPGTEKKPMSPLFNRLFYAQSKAQAEDFIVRASAEMEACILNPTFLIGPYDHKPSSGKIIRMAWGKKIVFYPPGGKNFVPVKDVAQAIYKSLTICNPSGNHLIAGENLTYKEFYTKLRSITHDRQVLIPLPKPLLLLLGYLGELIRKLGIKTSLSIVNMKILCIKNFYSNSKSRQVLDLEYSSVNQAIKEALTYFKAMNKQENTIEINRNKN